MAFIGKLKAFIFSERCPFCGKLIEAEEAACPDCLDEIKRKRIPLTLGVQGFRCVSSFLYGGKVKHAIRSIKFHDKTQFIPQLAKFVSADIKALYKDRSFDIITSIPMHPLDLRLRGYNQSKLLAKAIGKILDIPYEDTLKKIKRTKKQHSLKWPDRKNNLNGAFTVREKADIHGKSILLIDDILTSGNTLGKCAKKLSRSRPSCICCATIAASKNYFPDASVI